MNPLDATLMRVVDGDTVICQIRVRLRASAPELGTAQGNAAAARLRHDLRNRRRLSLMVHAVDDYGRAVASIMGGL